MGCASLSVEFLLFPEHPAMKFLEFLSEAFDAGRCQRQDIRPMMHMIHPGNCFLSPI